MESRDENRSVLYRLTNLSQTDILPQLPLPSIPISVRTEFSSIDVVDQHELCRDAALMSELDKMLQAADVSAM